jgi:hypothetical protein
MLEPVAFTIASNITYAGRGMLSVDYNLYHNRKFVLERDRRAWANGTGREGVRRHFREDKVSTSMHEMEHSLGNFWWCIDLHHQLSTLHKVLKNVETTTLPTRLHSTASLESLEEHDMTGK